MTEQVSVGCTIMDRADGKKAVVCMIGPFENEKEANECVAQIVSDANDLALTPHYSGFETEGTA